MTRGESSGSTASIPETVRYKIPLWRHDHISTNQSLITALVPPKGGGAEHCEGTPPLPTPTPSQLYFSLFDGNKKKIQLHDIIKSPLGHGGSTPLREARPPRVSENYAIAFWEFVSMGRVQFCGREWFDNLHLETSTLTFASYWFDILSVAFNFEIAKTWIFKWRIRFEKLPHVAFCRSCISLNCYWIKVSCERATWLHTLCADGGGNWDVFPCNSLLYWIYNCREMWLYIKLIWGRGSSRSHGKAWVWNNKKLLNRRARRPREENTQRKSGDSSMTASAAAAAVEINLPRIRASAASMHLGKIRHLVTFYRISSLNTHVIELHIVFYRTFVTVAEALPKNLG